MAQQIRLRLFAAMGSGPGQDLALVISSDPANKTYLSGYASMIHDLAPQYRSAVLATRDDAALVLAAADVGPAAEVVDAARLFPYGEFYFETAGPELAAALRPAVADFNTAMVAALEALARGKGLVGVDRSDGDVLWSLAQDRLGTGRIIDVTQALQSCRQIKTPAEILHLRQATRAVEAGIRRVIAEARAGMTEWDLAGMITAEMLAHGGVPRLLSITSGPRSALSDSYPTHRRIAPGEIIRIDAGCTVGGYWSDMARTLVIGDPDARQIRDYAALRSGLEAELAAVRAGVPVRALFDTAVQTVRANGLPQYRRQHCGHGIGLRSYDSPVVNATDPAVLQPGMCLCLETPYYVLGQDGMMVEDTIIVTESGYDPVTTMPRDLIVLA